VASGRRDAYLRASLLDRLMLPPGASRGGSQLVIGVRELRESVARDLDWLLNSRRFLDVDLEGLKEVRSSILNYGMPDYTPTSWRNDKELGSIARTIEDLLRRFEPRLRPGSIRVTALKPTDPDDMRPHFRIDAVLHVDPVNEPVSFDTDVDVETSRIAVRGDV
jgi:type VI secretion system protein ImpF